MSIRPSAAAVVAGLLLVGAVGVGTARAAPGDPPGSTPPQPCRSVTAGDYDGDTLSNYQECELGTSPVSNDTDRDNLSDPAELTLGSNPTNPNTDGDALRDGCEFSWMNAHGVPLDPVVPNADSDGDGIPNAIESWGGTNPYGNDTDQDLLRDGEEWFICTFKAGPDNEGPGLALDPDRDEDGLLDGIEVISTKTDPYDWDTDGDGWSDGIEVSPYGTDPLDATDKPSGYPPGHQ